MPESNFLVSIFMVIAVLVIISKAVVIVPQNMAYIVERLGKYHDTMTAGMQFVIPFIDRIAYPSKKAPLIFQAKLRLPKTTLV